MPAHEQPTHRIARVNSLIQQIVGATILPLTQESGALVTVSKVETTIDMKSAKIWISIVGPKDNAENDEKILKLLRDNIYDIQGELNHKMHTKALPRIEFHLDTAPRYVQHIDELITQIHHEDES